LKKSAANASRFGGNATLKRLLAEAMLDNAGLKDRLEKMAPLTARREAAAHLWMSLGVSERQECSISGRTRSRRAQPAR